MDASLSDIAALVNRNDGFLGGGGVGFIILLFIFIWAVFGGNGFGGRNGDYVTQAELQNGLYNQTTDRNLADIQMQMSNNAATQAQCCCNTQKAILEDSYKTLLGFKDQQMTMFQQYADLSKQISETNHQMSDCCCSIKTQMLQDKFDIQHDQLMLSQFNQLLNQRYPYYGYYGYYGTGTATM